MKSEIRNIYPHKEHMLEKFNAKLNNAKILKVNKKLILSFQHYLFSKGSGQKRVVKLSAQLLNMCLYKEHNGKVLKTAFNCVLRDDLLSLVSYINRNKNHSEATKSDYRRCIKQFYSWFREDDPRIESDSKQERDQAKKLYRFLDKEISISYKKKQIDPATILHDEDVQQVVSKGCRSIKEKALIKFLHETGVRAGELLNLRWRDIQIKKNIGVAFVNGKTGRRQVHFAQSLSYLVRWKELHPTSEDPLSYIWLGEKLNDMHKPLLHRGVQKLIDRCFERADMNKKHNLHWFRHSRASLLAPKLSESVLCRYMGWVPGSRQVKAYVHLCPQQVEDAILRINGLAAQEEEQNLPQTCSCGSINDGFARYCLQCGNPLSVDVALTDQERLKDETNKTIKAMMEMFKDPGLLRAFQEFKRLEAEK